MAKIDDIYDAVDDYGLITSTEGRELGVSDAELVQLAARDKGKQLACMCERFGAKMKTGSARDAEYTTGCPESL